MFWDKGDIALETLRNHNGESKRIGRIIEKYPPVYINDLVKKWEGKQKSVGHC
jgi:hypothetical protein